VINWVLNTQKRKNEREGSENMSYRKKENHMAAWGATFLESKRILLVGPGTRYPEGGAGQPTQTGFTHYYQASTS